MGALRGSIKITKRPPPPQVQYRAVQQEIKKQLEPVSRAYLSSYQNAVSNFKHKPDFESKTTVTEKQITMTVKIKNANAPVSGDWTIGDMWASLDTEGTKPHTITPKKAGGKLRFSWGGPGSYQPKTRPLGRSGGPGTVNNGAIVYRKQVKHPGTKPRKFTETFHKRLKRQYDQAIDRGVRLGLTKANR